MADLLELIQRGRLLLSNSPKRMQVFKLTNGKNSTKEVSLKIHRSLSVVNQDYEKLRDMELVRERKNGEGLVKKEGSQVYEKVPLIKHVSLSYFEPVSKTDVLVKKSQKTRNVLKKLASVRIPNDKEILDIAKHGEDQVYEFKEPGVETEKITREIAGLVHTKEGGIIFYGITDDGTIVGTNINRQKMDEKIQNSLRYTVSSHPEIKIVGKNVIGTEILLIIVPPWDKKTIYQYTKDGRYYIRRGTNVFALKSEEIQKLSKGEYIV